MKLKKKSQYKYIECSKNASLFLNLVTKHKKIPWFEMVLHAAWLLLLYFLLVFKIKQKLIKATVHIYQYRVFQNNRTKNIYLVDHISSTVGKNPLEEWSSSHGQQKSLKCRTWVESQKWQDDLSTLPKQTFNIAVIQVYVPATNAEEAEVK